jgi:hypothetical protein
MDDEDSSRAGDADPLNDRATQAYSVGYGRPPVGNRFRKGNSGNPAGRPRKLLSNVLRKSDRLEAIRRAALRPVEVTIGTEVTEMPAYEVILNRMFADATRGKDRAVAKALELIREAEIGVESDDPREEVEPGRPAS